MDEARLRALVERLSAARDLETRRSGLARMLEERGKLTPELRERIAACGTRAELEDLALPFRPRRRSRAADLRERGLEPLAEYLWQQETDAWSLEEHADVFIDPEKQVPTREAALEGACQILAEWIAEQAEVRKRVRTGIWKTGFLVSRVVPARAQEKSKYAMYFDHREALPRAASHRVLAIRRGSKEGILASGIECADGALLEAILEATIRDRESVFAPFLEAAARESYARLLRPAIEAEVRAELKERADREAIRVFQTNLASLLLAPPAGAIPVLGIHSGKGSELRLAAIDASGALVPDSVGTLDGADAEALRAGLKTRLEAHPVAAVAIASSSARALEPLVRRLLADEKIDGIFVASVNDSGLAAYAGSRPAREELPDLEPAARAAVSVAPRRQDPLAELVKVDPRAIGVGQYQHDVSQRDLARRLGETIRSCVSHVGLDLNRAPLSLLRHAGGLDEHRARAIVEHRTAAGPFPARAALRALPEIGEHAYTQAAGFVRVTDGDNALDRTGIHPEHYPVVERMAAALGAQPGDLVGKRPDLADLDLETFVADGIGARTLRDIRDELLRPARDPRPPFARPKLRAEATSVAEVKEGMTLEGVVTNVTNFGAFVDIGVGQDGLVHLSQMSNRFIRDPREAVRVGDVITVKVISVEAASRRIGLSIKALLPPPRSRRKPPAGRERPRREPRADAAASGEGSPATDTPARSGERPERPRGAGPRGRGPRRLRRHGPRRPPPDRREPGPIAAEPDRVERAPEPVPEEPQRTLQEKIAILQSKFRGIS
jgi:uncharacterized protein